MKKIAFCFLALLTTSTQITPVLANTLTNITTNTADATAPYFSLNTQDNVFNNKEIVLTNPQTEIIAAKPETAQEQYNTGLNYLKATRPNTTLAAHWIGLAAQAGLGPAQYDLAMMYLQGLGVQKQPLQAIGWLYKAAKQGYVNAQQDLSWLFKQGHNLWKKDYTTYRHIQNAALRGDDKAQATLESLSKQKMNATRAFQQAMAHYQATIQLSPEANASINYAENKVVTPVAQLKNHTLLSFNTVDIGLASSGSTLIVVN